MAVKDKREHSWERASGETRVAYDAFLAYLKMGTQRSLVKVSHQLGKSKELLDRWSGRWDWQARIEAYDAHQLHKMTEADARESARTGIRLANAREQVVQRLLDMFEAADTRMKEWLQRPAAAGEDLTLDQLERLIGLMKELRDLAAPIIGLVVNQGGQGQQGGPQVAISVGMPGGAPVVNPELLHGEDLDHALMDRFLSKTARDLTEELQKRKELPDGPIRPEDNGAVESDDADG